MLPIFTDGSLVPPLDREDIHPEILQKIEADSDAETLQFVIKAVPCSLEKKYALLQEQLHRTEAELEEFQHQHQHTQTQLRQTQAELGATQSQLRQTQAELGAIQTQLHQTQTELNTAQTMLKAIESSKFWRLRLMWVRIRKRLTRSSDLFVD
jgi:septal ring factor EnvC (AmiA/AmiB activator)